jgi:hypothetical protein
MENVSCCNIKVACRASQNGDHNEPVAPPDSSEQRKSYHLLLYHVVLMNKALRLQWRHTLSLPHDTDAK